jgi:hypothetical protein
VSTAVVSGLFHVIRAYLFIIYYYTEMVCSVCDEPVFDDINVEDMPNTVIFFCRHAYHESCLVDTRENGFAETTSNPGTLTSKVNHAALLKSSQNMACPLCREQAAGGNAFVNRMKSQKRGKRSPQSPRADSIRSFGTVH